MEAKISHNRVVLREEDEILLSAVLQSGQIGQGPHVQAFEAELANRFRPGGEAVCVSNGTAALRLVAMVLGLEPVVIPTYSCIALYHAVADIVTDLALSDCESGTLNSPEATVVVHTYGLPCVVPKGAIEDFTHAPGAELEGRPCGSFGVASVISFGATKPLGLGGGGAVLGPAEFVAEIRDMRDYDGKRDLRPRFNWQMPDLLAALGRQRLERLDFENDERRGTADRYLAVCAEKGLRVQGTSESTWYRFVVYVDEPRAAIAHFLESGIQVINPLETWELVHRQLKMAPADFPNAEDAAESTISLPIWPGMTEREIVCVLEALKCLKVAA